MMTARTRRITAAVLISLLPHTVALPALAQPADNDATTVQARARFKEGVEAFDKGRYEEARLAFLQAYTLKKHPAVLLNLAQSTAKSNRPLEAAGYFKQYLKEATTATPQQKKDAETGLAEVRTKIGQISVVAPPGTEVTIDDQKVGTTPLEIQDVEPGQHTVKGGSQTVTVTAAVGQKTEARLFPSEKPAPPPPPAEPPPAQPAKPAEPAKPVEPPKPAEEKPGAFSAPDPMWPVYVGLGVTGVGAVGAILFGIFKSQAQSKADDVAADIRTKATTQYGQPSQGACNNPALKPNFDKACATLRDNNKKVDTDATIANVSLVVMGVGIVGTVVYYLAGPKRGETSEKTGQNAGKSERPTFIQKPTISPWAGYQSGGLTLSADLF
jgi:hypothetical protein